MDYIIAVILGAVQGVTEFLPVSSSGHLVILQSLFKMQEGGIVLDTILHLGTAIAIMAVFYKDIIGLITGPFSADSGKRKDALTMILFLIIATIPAAILGVKFDDYFEALFSNPRAAGGMLIITSLILFVSASRKNDGNRVTLVKALVIGLAQAVAILPGISRSGTTIAVALLIGVAREEAGKFSFLMALPAILGAGLLHARKIESLDMQAGALIAGFLVSIVMGIISLKLLMQFVKKGKLYYFGFYCCIVGILSVIFIR